ncbi:MAG: hypothetical protein HY329_18245 [Chloroflexi bacterium]|nr:hypothetical protein [Chloroflexota bacterium]
MLKLCDVGHIAPGALRLAREALGSAVPATKPAKPRARPRIEPVAAFIEAILAADRKAPRKQRHTARRIYTRLQQERPEAVIAEPTVRRYVRERKQALGLLGRAMYVPQQYEWGAEGQMDWYEAVAEIDGERINDLWQYGEPGATLTGIVTSASTGLPVLGASLTLYQNGLPLAQE